jgi:hypothetical protein
MDWILGILARSWGIMSMGVENRGQWTGYHAVLLWLHLRSRLLLGESSMSSGVHMY